MLLQRFVIVPALAGLGILAVGCGDSGDGSSSDAAPPISYLQVSATNPADGNGGVFLDQSISISFDRALQATSWGPDSVGNEADGGVGAAHAEPADELGAHGLELAVVDPRHDIAQGLHELLGGAHLLVEPRDARGYVAAAPQHDAGASARGAGAPGPRSKSTWAPSAPALRPI